MDSPAPAPKMFALHLTLSLLALSCSTPRKPSSPSNQGEQAVATINQSTRSVGALNPPRTIPFHQAFEVSRSADHRYRIHATRLKKYEDEGTQGPDVDSNHAYFRIQVEDAVTKSSVPFPRTVFLYYGALHPESIHQAFIWHPSRPVLMFESESARHWNTYQVWEFASGIATPVPAPNCSPTLELHPRDESKIYFSSIGLAYAEKAAQPVHIGTSPPDPLPDDRALIGSIHSYGRFQRWSGDDILFEVELDVGKTNATLESVGGIRDVDGKICRVAVEGRLRFTPSANDKPARVTISEVRFRPEKGR
jgi:hypothetical protein